jgi:hypothetical protein
MNCPNCGSSKVRQSKRSIGEKIFLSLLVTRPFRCEDCIARFYGWLWRSSPQVALAGNDANSLVYRSSTAALHSTSRKSRGWRRKSKPAAARPQPQPAFSVASSVSSWMSKPIRTAKEPVRESAPAIPPRRIMPEPPQRFFPEVLGVILEVKH